MEYKGYKNLIVWQKAVELVQAVYELTSYYPKSEQFGIIAQMRSAAISIPSNIAEGSRRISKKDFKRFLKISFGSGAELETLLGIAKTLPFSNGLNYTKTDNLLDEVMRILNRLAR